MNRQKRVPEPKKKAIGGSSFSVLAETEPALKQGSGGVDKKETRKNPTPSKPVDPVPLKSIMKRTEQPDRSSDSAIDLQLIQRYDSLVELIQHRKLETYARLLQLLFGCFTIPDEPGPITIRTGELVRILEKTQTKYELAIQNESMERVLRIFTAICKKLGGTPEYRLTHITDIESRMHKLYSDSELLAFLYELEGNGIRPETIQRISSRDELVLKTNTTVPLPVSQKWKDFVDILMKGQSDP